MATTYAKLRQYEVHCACGGEKRVANTDIIRQQYNLINMNCQYCSNVIADRWFFWCAHKSYFHQNNKGLKQYGIVCFACIKRQAKIQS